LTHFRFFAKPKEVIIEEMNCNAKTPPQNFPEQSGIDCFLQARCVAQGLAYSMKGTNAGKIPIPSIVPSSLRPWQESDLDPSCHQPGDRASTGRKDLLTENPVLAFGEAIRHPVFTPDRKP